MKRPTRTTTREESTMTNVNSGTCLKYGQVMYLLESGNLNKAHWTLTNAVGQSIAIPKVRGDVVFDANLELAKGTYTLSVGKTRNMISHTFEV
jgi:hypothetical protein